MKKIVVLCIILFAAHFAQAQVNPHALGLRLGGDGDVNGAELSYQHGLGETNRLELDLGYSANSNESRTLLAGIYHWDWNIFSGFNWYTGPGAAVGYYSHDNFDDQINFSIGGQIGLEFDFNEINAPILVSLDARPMWDLIGDNSGLGWGAALGLRYTW